MHATKTVSSLEPGWAPPLRQNMAGLSPAVWTVTVATMLAAFWPVWVWY